MWHQKSAMNTNTNSSNLEHEFVSFGDKHTKRNVELHKYQLKVATIYKSNSKENVLIERHIDEDVSGE